MMALICQRCCSIGTSPHAAPRGEANDLTYEPMNQNLGMFRVPRKAHGEPRNSLGDDQTELLGRLNECENSLSRLQADGAKEALVGHQIV